MLLVSRALRPPTPRHRAAGRSRRGVGRAPPLRASSSSNFGRRRHGQQQPQREPARARTAREVIENASPARSEVTGLYRERPHATDRVEIKETPCILVTTSSLLLPGEHSCFPVDEGAWRRACEATRGKASLGEVVVANEGMLFNPRGSRSILATVDKVSRRRNRGGQLILDVTATERVVVESTQKLDERIRPDLTGVGLSKATPLRDRWAYFVVLDSLRTQAPGEGAEASRALADLEDAHAALSKSVDRILRHASRGRAKRWREVADFVTKGGQELIPRCARASFAALCEADGETRDRAMATADLGERLELAAKEAKRIENVVILDKGLR